MYIIRMLVSVVLMFLMVNGVAIGKPVLSMDRTLRMAGNTRVYLKDNGRIFAFSISRDPADLTEYKAACGRSDYGTIVKNNDVDLVGALNENTSEFIDGAALRPSMKYSQSIFVGLTKAGEIECITTDEIVINNYNGTETQFDNGTSCKGISGITGVKELVDFEYFLGAWKHTGELIYLIPADPTTGEQDENIFQFIKDPKLRAALENPSEHPEYFGMIKPLYPDGISDITYTYSAEYSHTSDFYDDVEVNVTKEQRVDGDIKNSFNIPVVLFTNSEPSDYVYESIDSENLKYYLKHYYTDQSLAEKQPVVSNTGDNVTVKGWAIRWDVKKTKHSAWGYMLEHKRNGELEKSNAQRKFSALVSVRKTVEK